MNSGLKEMLREKAALLHKSRVVAVYGAGEGGKHVYQHCRGTGKEVPYVIDDFKEGMFLDVKIIKPKEARNYPFPDLLVFTCGTAASFMLMIKKRKNWDHYTPTLFYLTPFAQSEVIASLYEFEGFHSRILDVLNCFDLREEKEEFIKGEALYALLTDASNKDVMDHFSKQVHDDAALWWKMAYHILFRGFLVYDALSGRISAGCVNTNLRSKQQKEEGLPLS